MALRSIKNGFAEECEEECLPRYFKAMLDEHYEARRTYGAPRWAFTPTPVGEDGSLKLSLLYDLFFN
jgi:hypothetical protein